MTKVLTQPVHFEYRGSSVAMVHDGDTIGEVYVVEDRDDDGNDILCIKESWIDVEFLGLGLDTRMYVELLDHLNKAGLPIFSGDHGDSEKVWQSMAKHGWILQRTGRKSPHQKYQIFRIYGGAKMAGKSATVSNLGLSTTFEQAQETADSFRKLYKGVQGK